MATRSRLVEGLVGQQSLLDVALGQETAFQLTRSVQTHRLAIRLAASLTISAGAASGTIQNRGSLFGLVEISLDDSGSRETILPGSVLKMFSEMFAPRALNDFTRLTSGAAATYPLDEGLVVHFALPSIMRPKETAFMERDRNKPLTLYIRTAADPRAALSSGNDRTWAFNSFTAEVGQDYGASAHRPAYVPVIRRIGSKIVSGAANDQEIPIASDKHLAAIIVQQTASGFEVGDIIDSLEIRSDRNHIVGNGGNYSLDYLEKREQAKFGGGLPVTGYSCFRFLDGGRLTDMVNPVEDSNLRVKFNCDGLSATAGTNRVDVWGLEMQRVANVTAPRVPGDED